MSPVSEPVEDSSRRIEPAPAASMSPPTPDTPPATLSKPLFAPGQLRRGLGIGLSLTLAAVVVYALASHWAGVVSVAHRGGSMLLRVLAMPATPPVLVALAFAVLVVFTTRKPAHKPVKAAPDEIEALQVAPVRTPFWRWVLAVLLLLSGLLAQAAYIFRTELATLVPEARAPFERLCASFGCTVPLPRRSELVSIEASDLHPVPGRNNQLQLLATVRNRASFRQQWPHFEITLTDVRDQPVLRRVLAPAEYLSASLQQSPGFDRDQEVQVELTLELDGVVASGYRLYLFYP